MSDPAMSGEQNTHWDLYQQVEPHKRLQSHEAPANDHCSTANEDPWEAAPGRTFGEMYLSGELPWPQEPLLQYRDDPEEVVEEYLTLLADYARAEHADDQDTMRRLQGELESAQDEFRSMDTYSKAGALIPLTTRLTAAVQQQQISADPSRTATVEQALPEVGRFNGPAPFYRRGRAYIQTLAPAFELAALGHGALVSRRPNDADQLLRAVEALDTPQDLQDFIAGAVRELHRQLNRLTRQRPPREA